MYELNQCFKYNCLNCKSILERMTIAQPDDVLDCYSCRPKAEVKFIVDGAPTGFVVGGVSNKAGFSKGKVFNGTL